MVADFILLAINPRDPVFLILPGGLLSGHILLSTSVSAQNIMECLSCSLESCSCPGKAQQLLRYSTYGPW